MLSCWALWVNGSPSMINKGNEITSTLDLQTIVSLKGG